jgi:Arc/MetJ family transcription regulator
MRTNIELNEDLVREARKLSRTKTKKALIEEALATFIQVETARQRRETYAERLQGIQTKLAKVRLRDSPQNVLRQDRSR